MSSMIRGSSRAMEEASGIVRRMVSLPRSILGGFSRAMSQVRIGSGSGSGSGRRNQTPPSNIFPPPPPQNDQATEEINYWAFLASFEQQYGPAHPFFYACRFADVLRMAREEHRLVFLYLHSPDHPFAPRFCRETLCCEVVVEYLDANFVSWGGLANGGEGLHMAVALQPATFPFCAIVAPPPSSSDDDDDHNMAILQQMEGPVSPAELLEILQRTMEEQGLAFGNNTRAKEEEEKRRADRQLKEEQDAAYRASLRMDKEKEKLKTVSLEENVTKPSEASKKLNSEKLKQNPTRKQSGTTKEADSTGKNAQVTKILLRFPNGERREQSFLCTDKIQSIYGFVDSLGLQGLGNYKLISSFPRKVYGVDQVGMTLKDAGLHPRASLFLELM